MKQRLLGVVAAAILAVGAAQLPLRPAGAVDPTTTTTTVLCQATTTTTSPTTSTSSTVPCEPTTTTTAPATTTTPPPNTVPATSPPNSSIPSTSPPSATTLPGATTSTAAATKTTLPPGAGVVPPPPPAPPVPPLPDLAAKMARAATLEQQIADQSTALDRLSDTYNKARQVELATDSAVADAVGQLNAGETAAADAVATIASSEQALRRTALDGYLDMGLVANTKGTDTLTRAYQQAIARVYSGDAFETGSQRIKELHTAERNLRDIQKRMVDATKRAEAESAAAQAAAQRAQAAVDKSAGQQGALLATLTQLQGGVSTLVDIQKASMALTAYQRISSAGSLLFTPSSPLPPLLPETAAVLKSAIAQVGKPYVWGATGPDSFDCSGLTQWSWKQSGVGLPRVAADQQAWAIPVPISQVQPGDLVFFGNPAHHVGLYVGGGMMVEAPHTGAVVDITSVWWDDLAGFGRVHR